MTTPPKIHCPTWGTHPVVLHCPGPRKRRHPIFDQVAERIFAADRPWWGCPSELTILTWCDGDALDPAAWRPTILQRCLDHWGIPYATLRASSTRKRCEIEKPCPKWNNWLKIPLTLRYIEQHVHTHYIMGLDATDALLLDKPSVVLERFVRLTSTEFGWLPKCELLFGAERNHYPRKDELKEQTRAEQLAADGAGELPFCHLNSGQFIGTTDAAFEWFSEALRRPRIREQLDSDQGVWRSFYLASREQVAIDRKWEIFAVAAGRYDPGDVLEIEGTAP